MLYNEQHDTQLSVGVEISTEITIGIWKQFYFSANRCQFVQEKSEKLEDGAVHLLEDICIEEISTKRGQVYFIL